jgi:hypothetical protein
MKIHVWLLLKKDIDNAHENGCPWNATPCSSAAESGRLEVLKYAHENGCQWNAAMCTAAAAAAAAARSGRYLEELKYALACKCSLNEATCHMPHVVITTVSFRASWTEAALQ